MLSKRQKIIYDADSLILVDKINPTITSKQSALINSQTKSISGLKPMLKGSLPADDNNLTLYELEKESIINDYPNANKYIKSFVGARRIACEFGCNPLVQWY